MRVVITGGSGLIGRTLANLLACHGYEVTVVSRSVQQTLRMYARHGMLPIQVASWDVVSADGWGILLNSECALVNLAGATPAHWRWTSAYRAHILQNRLRESAMGHLQC